MRKITFDIETKNLFQDVGSNNPADLDISVVCIHDSLTDTYSSFVDPDYSKLWPLIEQADILITFNGDHFDIPLLEKYYKKDLKHIKSIDLLKEVKNSLGKRIKLDSIAEATLGRNKSGHGLEAIGWWKTGEVDKIIKYCTEDVRITKELYEYALKNKHLKYKDMGVAKDIPIDPSNWEKKDEKKETFTLGF
ncbi:MAG TPA: ribonuclease H-like domain-containing protein [Candidatus Paceibacterota bacterium]|jgi:DEAD/DEAH box helicase domain-containing protein|nr:ribonuclease H-like domain-containing protein [Candidatus Paceibacterota bacterium]